MSPLKHFLAAGDRIDDVASGLAIGLSLFTPVAQAVGFIGDAVPDMSITSAIALTLLTLGRMAFGHLKSVEENRHKEAVLKLEIEKLLLQREMTPAEAKVAASAASSAITETTGVK